MIGSLATAILLPTLAILVVGFALAAVSLATAWRGRNTDHTFVADDHQRIALQDKKARVLLALADLELEHQLGKLSDDDFANLRSYFQHEALGIIEQLDALDQRPASEGDPTIGEDTP